MDGRSGVCLDGQRRVGLVHCGPFDCRNTSGSYTATTGAFGDNIAGVMAKIEGADADTFIKAFIAAKSQIAFNDGISDGSHLLGGYGSTKSGQALSAFLK